MLTIDMDRLQKTVAEQVVDDLIDNDKIKDEIRKKIDARIDALFADSAKAILEERVSAAIHNGFERSYQRVDQWGRPVGDPSTIAKELNRIVGSYWNERVGKDGKPTDSSYSSMSRAEYVMSQICAEKFSEEMKQHALNVTGALKDGFRTQIGKHMDNMLNDLFKVKSLQDQGKVEKPY